MSTVETPAAVSTSPPPARRHRKALGCILLALLWAMVEAFSFVLLWVTDGARPGPARWEGERVAAVSATEIAHSLLSIRATSSSRTTCRHTASTASAS